MDDESETDVVGRLLIEALDNAAYFLLGACPPIPLTPEWDAHRHWKHRRADLLEQYRLLTRDFPVVGGWVG